MAGPTIDLPAQLAVNSWCQYSGGRRAGLAWPTRIFLFLLPGRHDAGKTAVRVIPRRRQERRPRGAVRIHQDPQLLHRLTDRTRLDPGVRPILVPIDFICIDMQYNVFD